MFIVYNIMLFFIRPSDTPEQSPKTKKKKKKNSSGNGPSITDITNEKVKNGNF